MELTQQIHLIITIAAAIAGLAIMFVATKPFVRLLWFILFCYPHALTAGLLPLNMGIDDFYILALGTVIFIRNKLSGTFIFGFASKAALIFWFISSISDVTGALTGSSILWEGTIKVVLKGIVYLFFAMIMDNTLTDETEIKRTLNWVLLAGFGGAITVIGQHFFEPMFQMFTLYRPESWEAGNVRGGGAFLNPNAGGIMMMIFLLLAIAQLSTGRLVKSKPIVLALCAVFLAGLAVSQSRSAVIGTAAAGLVLALFSPLRRYAIIVGIIAIPLLVYTQFSSLISERFITAGESATFRKAIWLTIIQNPSPFILFCGRGASAEMERLQATPHNTYLHIIFELGLAGTIWAFWFFLRLIKNARFLNKSEDSTFRSWGSWCIYSLVGLAVAGVAMEVLFIDSAKYTLFLMAALTSRAVMLEAEQPLPEIIDEEYNIESYSSEEAT